jgi:hypothetical protein
MARVYSCAQQDMSRDSDRAIERAVAQPRNNGEETALTTSSHPGISATGRCELQDQVADMREERGLHTGNLVPDSCNCLPDLQGERRKWVVGCGVWTVGNSQ